MIRVGISLSFLLAAALSVQAATNRAPSAQHGDVLDTLLQCVDGDTLLIPSSAGQTIIWPNPIEVNTAVTIQGAGTNSAGTILTYSFAGGSGGGDPPHFFRINLPTASRHKPVRITNIRMNAQTGTGRSSIKALNNCMQLRIDHCFFQGGNRTLWLSPSPQSTWAFGCVDHNTFLNCQVAVAPDGGNHSTWLTFPQAPSTTNVVCVEDNHFIANSGHPVGYRTDFLYHAYGGRSVIRYNTFTVSSPPGDYWQNMYDAHGNQGPNCPPDSNASSGTQVSETYMNTFNSNVGASLVAYLRGGQHFCWSNTVNFSPGGVWGLFEAEGVTACPPAQAVCNGAQRITNSFFWNNLVNGVLTSGGSSCNSTYVRNGIEFWNEAPGAGNGNPVGAYAGYTPLVYPHPLVSGPDTNNPIISVTVTNLNFGPLFTNTEATLNFGVTNTGSGTLSGTASVVGAPFSITAPTEGAYSLAAGTGTNVAVKYNPTSAAFHTNLLSFSGAATYSALVRGSACIVQPGLSWEATNGTYSYPWINAGGGVLTNRIASGVNNGGVAIYGFTVTNGYYCFSNYVNAIDGGADSCWVSVNAYPTLGDAQIWRPSTGGTTNWQRVSQISFPSYGNILATNLSAGNHKLIVIGREVGLKLGQWVVAEIQPQNADWTFTDMGAFGEPGVLRVTVVDSPTGYFLLRYDKDLPLVWTTTSANSQGYFFPDPPYSTEGDVYAQIAWCDSSGLQLSGWSASKLLTITP